MTTNTTISNSAITNPNVRHDFLFAVEYINSLPNGDPNTDNMPRFDYETMHGLATDVSVKRKIRNYVQMQNGLSDTQGVDIDPMANEYDIYVAQGTYLTTKQREAYIRLNLEAKEKPEPSLVDKVAKEMKRKFYDVRMFGAVMTTGKVENEQSKVIYSAGQVRGPIQLGFGQSVDPILPMTVTITRVAKTNSKDEQNSSDEDGSVAGTMGRKHIIPYGLYLFKGHFNPFLARECGVTEKDLALFWEALQNVWDLDASAARGEVNLRDLHIFTHASPLGNARAHKLYDLVQYAKKDGVEYPRSYQDYITPDTNVINKGLPANVTYARL
jgi:CRISPR-associated protein Csd2